ncbi:hypothetical protein F4810DRAFT_159046 [Camillea tinctor]|nr:hypothetical protein F4810DRAFT_159046 [Camillea tinctor]
MASQDTVVRLVDTRPKPSPYASSIVTFFFGEGPPLRIPVAFVKKAPKLYSRCGSDMSLCLKDVSRDCSHVLVHYLYTDQYQCLKPSGSSDDRRITKFKTSLEVYSIAKTYELSGLRHLSQAEIERHGRRLQVAQILKIMNDAKTTLAAEDTWLHEYIKSLAEEMLGSPPSSLSNIFSEAPSQALTIDRALLKAMIELSHENASTPPATCASPSGSPNNVQDSQGQGETIEANGLTYTILNTHSTSKESLEGSTSPEVFSETAGTASKTRRDKRDEKQGEEEEEEEEEDQPYVTDITTLSAEETLHEMSVLFNSRVEQREQIADRIIALLKKVRKSRNLFSHENDLMSEAFQYSKSTMSGFELARPFAGVKPPDSRQDVAHIPSTVGAYMPLEQLENPGRSLQINRFLNICTRKGFERFSPEELRWKHEVDSESQKNTSNPNLPPAPLVPHGLFYFKG